MAHQKFRNNVITVGKSAGSNQKRLSSARFGLGKNHRQWPRAASPPAAADDIQYCLAFNLGLFSRKKCELNGKNNA
jgi:hypothetical protein